MRWRLQPSLRIINTKLPYKGGGSTSLKTLRAMAKALSNEDGSVEVRA